MRFHLTPSSKSLQTINVGEDVEGKKKKKTLLHSYNINWYSHYGKQDRGSLKN